MRAGFSLIEVLAVLTLMSLVLVAISFRWNEPYQAVRFQSDLERLIDFDFKARRHAISRNRDSWLLYDLDRNAIDASRWVDSAEKRIGIQLGEGIRIKEFVTATGQATSGQAQLKIYADGSTSTYAVLIGHGEQQRWIVFAGRTGQTQITDELNDVETLFKKLHIQGADTN